MTAHDLLRARSLPRIGAAVKALRLRRGLSQARLAEMAGVSRQWIVALEKGRTEGLETGRLLRVLDALDASLVIRDDAAAEDDASGRPATTSPSATDTPW